MGRVEGKPSQQLIDESKRRNGNTCRALCLPTADRRFPQYDQWILVDDDHAEHLQRAGTDVKHVVVVMRANLGMAVLR
jgi:hypothetical protein